MSNCTEKRPTIWSIGIRVRRCMRVWPFWLELAQPELGYVDRRIETETVLDVSPQALASMDWSKVRILVVCNQNLGSRMEFLKRGWVGEIRKKFYCDEQCSGRGGDPQGRAVPERGALSNAAGSGWIFT